MMKLFRVSRRSLGRRTLMKNLRDEGFKIDRDRTRHLMIVLNLKVKKKCKYQVTTTASLAYQALLKRHGMNCSMSRKGHCWDTQFKIPSNVQSNLKREWTGDRLDRTRQEAIADIREYVAVYYNSKHLHSTLGDKTPMNYENDLNKVSGIS